LHGRDPAQAAEAAQELRRAQQGGGGRLTRRGDLGVLVAVGVAYLLVRLAWAPTGGWARGHVTDVLAGVALPSLVALVLGGGELGRWARTLRGKLSLVLGATLVWEGLMPLLSREWTADPLDALSYLGGTLVHHALFGRSRAAGD
jgi:hypothetical protein